MERDFEIGQSNEIIRDGRVFDLHNQYDFSRVEIGGDRTVKVFFDPNPEHGSGEPSVVLEFLETDFLELSPGFGTSLNRDLDEMGYVAPQQHDDVWLLGESQCKGEEHLFFRLTTGDLRIHAQKASLRTRSR